MKIKELIRAGKYDALEDKLYRDGCTLEDRDIILYSGDNSAISTFEEYQASMLRRIAYPTNAAEHIKDCSRSDSCFTCYLAYSYNPYLVKELKEPSTRLMYELVTINPSLVTYLKNPSDDLCLEAIKHDRKVLIYLPERSESFYLRAVQADPFTLCHIKKQTPAICLAAVRQCGIVLQYVDEQTPEICLAAIDNDHEAIQYIRPAIIRKALQCLLLRQGGENNGN